MSLNSQYLPIYNESNSLLYFYWCKRCIDVKEKAKFFENKLNVSTQ